MPKKVLKSHKLTLDHYSYMGFYLLISVIINQLANRMKYGVWSDFFWYCDIAALALAYGLIFRKQIPITFVFVTAGGAQFLWIIDILLEFFGMGLGRTSELATYGTVIFWLSLNLHLAVIPFAIYGVYKLGFARKAFIPGIIFFYVLLSAGFIFTPVSENINCVFFGCDVWPPVLASKMDYLPHFLINSLLFWTALYIPVFYGWKWVFRNRLV